MHNFKNLPKLDKLKHVERTFKQRIYKMSNWYYFIIGFEKRHSKIEDGCTGEELDRAHLKIKHITKVLSQVHHYDMEAYIEGEGDHKVTFQKHMDSLKNKCKLFKRIKILMSSVFRG